MNALLNQTKLWTAVITPFNEVGSEIDYASLEILCRIQAKFGIGILVAGSTGEGLSLSLDERKSLLKFVLALKLPVPIMAGVPAHNWMEAKAWMEFCDGLPLQAHLMTTPMYTKPGVQGQTNWFQNLLNMSHVPCMLYNIPGRTGIKLFPETIKNLSPHKNLWAIKDSSGSIESVVDYLEVQAGVQVYCGDDYLMPAMSAEGACGLVSVLSNVWPEQTKKYVEESLSGKVQHNKIWWRATKALFSASNPVPAKALLKHIGQIQHATVRLPLSLEDLKSFAPLSQANDEMQSWKGSL
jgi:4-hydroxy-tetrahydrodipicolinate synthase